MGAQENAHRPTSDFIGPISISNFTFSVVYMENARQDWNGKEYMEGDQPLEWIYL